MYCPTCGRRVGDGLLREDILKWNFDEGKVREDLCDRLLKHLHASHSQDWWACVQLAETETPAYWASSGEIDERDAWLGIRKQQAEERAREEEAAQKAQDDRESLSPPGAQRVRPMRAKKRTRRSHSPLPSRSRERSHPSQAPSEDIRTPGQEEDRSWCID